MFNRLDFKESFLNNNSNNSRFLFLNKNIFFFLFLRFQSFLFSSFEDVNNNNKSNYIYCCKYKSLISNITIFKSNNLFVNKSLNVLDAIESNTIESKAIFVTTTKFCITFQLHLLKERISKSKILLRLIQFKTNKLDTLSRT